MAINFWYKCQKANDNSHSLGLSRACFLLRNCSGTGNFPFNRCSGHSPLEGNNAAIVFWTLQNAVSVPSAFHPCGQVLPSGLCFPALMGRNWVQGCLRKCISKSGVCIGMVKKEGVSFFLTCMHFWFTWRARSEKRKMDLYIQSTCYSKSQSDFKKEMGAFIPSLSFA